VDSVSLTKNEKGTKVKGEAIAGSIHYTSGPFSFTRPGFIGESGPDSQGWGHGIEATLAS